MFLKVFCHDLFYYLYFVNNCNKSCSWHPCAARVSQDYVFITIRVGCCIACSMSTVYEIRDAIKQREGFSH